MCSDAIWAGWIKCDLFIAEVSGSSFGLGFEAGYLLGGMGKRVLLFYRRDLEKKVSLLITGNTHPNCTLLPYAAAEEVEWFLRTEVRDNRGKHLMEQGAAQH